MGQRKIQFAVDEFYHLYNRGNDKRLIFLSPDDYQRFVCSIYAANALESICLSDLGKWSTNVWNIKSGDTLVDIGAYCLMPNHFHLLVKEKMEGGITTFTRKLFTSYSSYFNLKHKRTGKLFEGSFKVTHADDDQYLRYLFAYIHLNPVKIPNPDEWPGKFIKDPEGARNFLQKFVYSSYHDYLGLPRKESAVLNREAFPEYFQDSREFEDFIQDWMDYSDTLEKLGGNSSQER